MIYLNSFSLSLSNNHKKSVNTAIYPRGQNIQCTYLIITQYIHIYIMGQNKQFQKACYNICIRKGKES